MGKIIGLVLSIQWVNIKDWLAGQFKPKVS